MSTTLGTVTALLEPNDYSSCESGEQNSQRSEV